MTSFHFSNYQGGIIKLTYYLDLAGSQLHRENRENGKTNSLILKVKNIKKVCLFFKSKTEVRKRRKMHIYSFIFLH